MTLTAAIKAVINATYRGVNDLGTPEFPLSISASNAFTNGVGINQADLIFSDRRTLAASANEDLDLAGVLTDPFGVVITFAKIKAILIKAASGNTNSVNIKPATTNGFLGPFNAAADTIKIPPNGIVLLTAPINGWPVTAGTADLINIANGGGTTSVDYDIIIIGTSA